MDCIFAARFAVVTCERFGLCRTMRAKLEVALARLERRDPTKPLH
jgi:hypothetical protein